MDPHAVLGVARGASDEEIKAAVLRFNRFDLYTKAEQRPDIPKLWPYYQTLIDRFLPGKISW